MAPASGTDDRRWRKRAFKLLALLIGLVLVEAGHRGFLAATGHPHRSAEVRETLLDMAADADDEEQDARREWKAPSHRLHPYLAFEVQHGTDEVRGLVRRTRNAGDSAFKVAFFGGSVAQHVTQKSWKIIVEKLEADPRLNGRRVQLLPLARAAYKQPQQVNLLQYYLSCGGLVDAVVNLDGFNEVAVAFQNYEMGVHPAYPSFGQYAHLAVASTRDSEALELAAEIRLEKNDLVRGAKRALGLGVHRSSVLSALFLPPLRRSASDVAEGFEAYRDLLARNAPKPGGAGALKSYGQDTADVRGPFPDEPDQPEDPVAACVETWKTCSISMDAMCRARGILYLHALQPTLHDEGSKPLTPEEIRKGRTGADWMEGAGRGYPMMRAAGAELVERGIAFHDSSYVFREVEETLYFDACHFEKPGTDLLAADVTEALLALLPR